MNFKRPLSLIKPETIAALTRHFGRVLKYHVGPDGHGEIRSGLDMERLAWLDRFVWLSLDAPYDPFLIKSASYASDVGAQTLGVHGAIFSKTAAQNLGSGAADDLRRCLRTFPVQATLLDLTNQAAGNLLLAPHIQLLRDMFFSHPVKLYMGCRANTAVGRTGRIVAELYNDFLRGFRQVMLTKNLLRRELHSWHLSSRENVENTHAYVDSLFDGNASLTVQHFRLFHAAERVSLIAGTVEEQHRDLAVLRACRTKFLDRIRRKPALFTEDPGYIWAILPSREGGYDLHFTLFFRTAALRKVLDDKSIEAEQTGIPIQDHADQVGEYWIETATDGLGIYIRCDKHPWLYGPEWVHGEVRADDIGRREKLKETLGYLAMRRALVRLKNEPPGQYFGMSELKARAPRRSAKSGVKGR